MKRHIASMKRGAQKGFTLIELMVVVAIVAFLSAFSLPAYQDYTIRTRIAEGLTLASAAKTAMTEYYSTNHTWPRTNSAAGMADASKIIGNAVKSVDVNGNMILITYNGKVGDISGKNLIKISAPAAPSAGESITWTCGEDSTTTVPARFLPPECRP